MPARKPARGKPAEYGDEIVHRRFRLLQRLISLENKKILDFGCGNGAQTVLLPQTCQVVAIDIDRQDLELLRHYMAAIQKDHILSVQFNGKHLPIASQSIDIGISFEVLEHVPDEAFALKEIHRVLKPGGALLLTVPNKWWIFETHGACLPLLPWNRVPFFSWLPRFIHDRFAKARIYRKADIRQLLLWHGFVLKRVQYVTAPLDVLKNGWLKRVLRAAFFRHETTRIPFLATSILVLAQKV